MTEEAKPVFLNAVIYINKFKGHHIIARKLNEGISTRTTIDEHKYTVSKENYEAYKTRLKISTIRLSIWRIHFKKWLLLAAR